MINNIIELFNHKNFESDRFIMDYCYLSKDIKFKYKTIKTKNREGDITNVRTEKIETPIFMFHSSYYPAPGIKVSEEFYEELMEIAFVSKGLISIRNKRLNEIHSLAILKNRIRKLNKL